MDDPDVHAEAAVLGKLLDAFASDGERASARRVVPVWHSIKALAALRGDSDAVSTAARAMPHFLDALARANDNLGRHVVQKIAPVDRHVIAYAAHNACSIHGRLRHAWVDDEWGQMNESLQSAPPVVLMGILRAPADGDADIVSLAAQATPCFPEDVVCLDVLGDKQGDNTWTPARFAAVVSHALDGGPDADTASKLLDRLVLATAWRIDGTSMAVHLAEVVALEPEAAARPLPLVVSPPLKRPRKLNGTLAAVGPVIRHLGSPWFIVELRTDAWANVAVFVIGVDFARHWFVAARASAGDVVAFTNLRRGGLRAGGAVVSRNITCYYTTEATTLAIQAPAAGAKATAPRQLFAREVDHVGVVAAWLGAGSSLVKLDGGHVTLCTAAWAAAQVDAEAAVSVLRPGTAVVVRRALVVGQRALSATPRTRISILRRLPFPMAAPPPHNDPAAERLLDVLCSTRSYRDAFGVRALLADVASHGNATFWLHGVFQGGMEGDRDVHESAFARLLNAVAWLPTGESRPSWYDDMLARCLASDADVASVLRAGSQGGFVPRAIGVRDLLAACLADDGAVMECNGAIFGGEKPLAFRMQRHELWRPTGEEDEPSGDMSAVVLVGALAGDSQNTGRWQLTDPRGDPIALVFSDEAARWARNVVNACGTGSAMVCISRFAVHAIELGPHSGDSARPFGAVFVDEPGAVMPLGREPCGPPQAHASALWGVDEEFWIVVPTAVTKGGTSQYVVKVLVLPIAVFTREPIAARSAKDIASSALLRVPVVELPEARGADASSRARYDLCAAFIRARGDEERECWPGFPEAPQVPELTAAELHFDWSTISHCATLAEGVKRAFLIPVPAALSSGSNGGPAFTVGATYRLPLEVSLCDAMDAMPSDTLHAALACRLGAGPGERRVRDALERAIDAVTPMPLQVRDALGLWRTGIEHANQRAVSIRGVVLRTELADAAGTSSSGVHVSLCVLIRDCRSSSLDTLDVRVKNIPRDALARRCVIHALCPGTYVEVSGVTLALAGSRRKPAAEVDATVGYVLARSTVPRPVREIKDVPAVASLGDARAISAASDFRCTTYRGSVVQCSRLEVELTCRACRGRSASRFGAGYVCSHGLSQTQFKFVAFARIVDGCTDAEVWAEDACAWSLLHGPHAPPLPDNLAHAIGARVPPVVGVMCRRFLKAAQDGHRPRIRIVAQCRRTEHEDNVDVVEGSDVRLKDPDRAVFAALVRDAATHGPAFFHVQPNDEAGVLCSSVRLRAKAVTWIDALPARLLLANGL